MAKPDRLVVVGASLAGLRAVEAARRAGYRGAIALIGAETHLPYDRPPLSKAFLERERELDPTYRDRDGFEDLGVDLLLGAPATALDADNRIVCVGGREVPYDALVIATGSVARSLPGTHGLAGVHTLRTIGDAQAVRRALDDDARTVVIGAGFVGSEVASSARKRGLDVTVLEAADTPLVRAVGAEAGAMLAQLHGSNGTRLVCGASVAGVQRTEGGLEVGMDDGSSYACDLVVVGIGATPATSWLEGSGIHLDDGIVCDEKLATGLPSVYAAGDVARWPNQLFGRTMRLEHWTSAAQQASVATLNALGIADAWYSTVPYFWSDWYGIRIQMVGIPAEGGLEVVAGSANEGRFVALYRQEDRLAGALCVGYPALTMKYRRLLAAGTSWNDALNFGPTID